jgi:hypothetical protein
MPFLAITPWTWALALERWPTRWKRWRTTSRSSRTSGGAIQPSASRPRRSMAARSLASRSSFLTRRLPQALPRGCERWTFAPSSLSRSAAQYQP